MKKKLFTTLCTLMMLIPWTILPLRQFPWALEMPAAEIMIASYAAFMIFSGIFTIFSYGKLKLQNTLMKICLVVNTLYGLFGILVFCLMSV